MIELRPLDLKQANIIVAKWHSHHKPVVGHRFSIGAYYDGAIVGAVIVGRPVSPKHDQVLTFEVTRLCTDGHKNAASRLLGAAWRAAKAMGATRIVSYTRADEDGTSYKAAGWRVSGTTKGRPWTYGKEKSNRWLPGFYVPSTEIIDRVRWEVSTDRAV